MESKKYKEIKSPLEKEVIIIIEKQMKELTKRDTQKIVKDLMPHFDRLIANKVKEHFIIIAEYIKDSFK